jgi:acyl carrier protein
MTRDEIRVRVAESLREFLASLGQKEVEIQDRTRPIGDLGLDSPDGLDWVLDLEEIGFSIPADFNPFVDDRRERARRFGEIVESLVPYYKGSAEVSRHD